MPSPLSLADVDRVLVIRLSSLGDVIHGLPVACALRRFRPSLRITWAIEEWAAPLVTDHPAIDRVVAFPTMRRFGETLPRRGWRRRFREAARHLREESYDVAIDLQGLFKSSLVSVLSRAPVRIGVEGQREGARLVSRAVPRSPATRHVIEEYVDAARYLGASAEPVRFDVPVRPDAVRSVEQRLAEAGVSPPLAVLAPSASNRKKAWPGERWSHLATGLDREGFSVLVVGGDAERRPHATIADANRGHLSDLTGKTTIDELGALLAGADLVVATDTGPGHLAAAFGRPVVAIHGPTDPERSAPWGFGRLAVSRHDLCRKTCPGLCPRRRCLDAVTVDDVLARVRAL